MDIGGKGGKGVIKGPLVKYFPFIVNRNAMNGKNGVPPKQFYIRTPYTEFLEKYPWIFNPYASMITGLKK